MSWNHRIIQQEEQYRIAEVYYVNDKPKYWSEISMSAESLSDLKRYHSWTRKAFKLPVLKVGKTGKFL